MSSSQKTRNSVISKSNKSLDMNKINKINNVNNINNINKIIKGSNTLLKLFCCLIIIVIICIFIGHYAFKNGFLTCEHYVFNTYLYIILAILLTFLVVLINDQTGIFNSLLIWMVQGSKARIIFTFIIMILILLGLTYALITVDPQNILASNLIWATVIFMIGVILIPTIWFGRLTDVVGLAGIMTILITSMVGIAGYYYGDVLVTFDWDKYLNNALWCLIIVIIIGSFIIKDPEQIMNFYLVISIFSLVIFVLLLLSNHKQLKEDSVKCIDGKVVPNYPFESYKLFIKIINIFQDFVRILGTMNGRK